MTNSKEKNKDKLEIEEIAIVEFITNFNESNINLISKGSINKKIHFGIQVVREIKLLSVDVIMAVVTKDVKENIIAQLHTACIFSNNSIEKISKQDKIAALSASIIDNILTISISTTRGIFFSYLQNTPLSLTIFPLRNTRTISKKISKEGIPIQALETNRIK